MPTPAQPTAPEASVPVTIILVEDEEAHIRLALKALRRAKFQNQVVTFTDGEQALTFLKSDMPPLPDLVLLDLDLPKLSGAAVLMGIRDDPRIKHLPVVVVTASDIADVPNTARAANAFMNKPVNFERLIEVVQQLTGFGWTLVKVRT